MHDADGFGAGSDSCFDQRVIYLQRTRIRFDTHRHQSVLRDAQMGGDIGISRQDHFIARLHDAQLDVRTPNPYQRIQSVGAADAVFGAYVVGIVLLEGLVLLALQIPAAVNHAACRLTDFLSVHICYVLKGQKWYGHNDNVFNDVLVNGGAMLLFHPYQFGRVIAAALRFGKDEGQRLLLQLRRAGKNPQEVIRATTNQHIPIFFIQ